MKISVIIPLFNKDAFIKETIQSVINQSFKDYEIIVINDGSTDNSHNEVRKIIDHRLRIISIPNSGVSFARNVGILNSQNNYVAFLDADDIWAPEFLTEVVNLIRDYADAKIFYTNYSNSKSLESRDLSFIRGYENNYYSPENNIRICSSNVVVDRTCFDQAGYFNTSLTHGEDLDMWKRLIMKFPIARIGRNLVTISNTDFSNQATNYLPDIRKKMDYYINLKSITNKVEQDYWVLHIYGNLSNYWRGHYYIDCLKILLKHKSFLVRFIKLKYKSLQTH